MTHSKGGNAIKVNHNCQKQTKLILTTFSLKKSYMLNMIIITSFYVCDNENFGNIKGLRMIAFRNRYRSHFLPNFTQLICMPLSGNHIGYVCVHVNNPYCLRPHTCQTDGNIPKSQSQST